jgi:hypothetical protein
MKLKQNLVCVFTILVLASCNNANEKTSASTANDEADAIYYGGDIITMEGDSAFYAESVVVKDGKIVFTGSKADAEKMKALLSLKGFQVSVVIIEQQNLPRYRVILGPFSSREAAETARHTIAERERISGMIRDA